MSCSLQTAKNPPDVFFLLFPLWRLDGAHIVDTAFWPLYALVPDGGVKLPGE